VIGLADGRALQGGRVPDPFALRRPARHLLREIRSGVGPTLASAYPRSEMAAERISTTSVARDVAETDPIVLRETEDGTRRLVFLPTLVDHPDPLRGCFVYQRKAAGDQWDDIRGKSLNTLKSGEGYTLELRSAEVSRLIDGLLARRSLYETYGIVFGDQEFVSTANLPQVVREILEVPDSALADALDALEVDDVIKLARKVDLSKLDSLLTEWESNYDNPSEDFWQDLLSRNAWVFSQLTGSPVVLLQEKAYVGGKSIANRGGGEIDYLVRNELTDNVSFIEIKTPLTPICSGSYRTSGSFTLDKEITGGIVQVLGYRERFDKEFYAARANSANEFQSYNARCLLIVDTASDLEDAEVRSFELFRNALTDVQILTFDEVSRRLLGIREVLVA
jgi:antiviral defense system Shedu protein SduA